MKQAKKNPEDNASRVLLRMCILCWILLFACFAIKLFGYNLFEIAVHNTMFIAICNYIQNSLWYYIISYIEFIAGMLLLYLIVVKDKKVFTWRTLGFLLVMTLNWIIKLLLLLNSIVINPILYSVIDYAYAILVLYLFTQRFWLSVLSIILMIVFTLVSLVTRNVGLDQNISLNYLVIQIYLIDYYIMLVLSFLYSKIIQNKRRQ